MLFDVIKLDMLCTVLINDYADVICLTPPNKKINITVKDLAGTQEYDNSNITFKQGVEYLSLYKIIGNRIALDEEYFL